MDRWQKENEPEENFVGKAVQGVVECEKGEEKK